MKKFVVAMTGASGSIFGIRLIRELVRSAEVHLVISSNTFSIIRDETGIDWKTEDRGQRTEVRRQSACGGDCPGFTDAAERSRRIGTVPAAQRTTEDMIRKHFGTKRLFFYEDKYMEAPIASGSFRTDGMFVVPCSMKTLSGIANGYANNLIERAADVVIKEGRPLLLSPREMPFSAIHLDNMLKLARLGVKIAPPVPAFYHGPKNIDDIVDFVTGKILDAFDIRHELFRRWGKR